VAYAQASLKMRLTQPSTHCIYHADFCDGIGGLCSDKTAKPLTIPKTPLSSTSNDPKTLRTEANAFVLKQLGQAHETPDKDK
jgi:hypothetical protein